MLKPKFFTYGSIVLVAILICFGYATRKILKENIAWDERSLLWSDFTELNEIESGFDAFVYSQILYPYRISENDSRVYAYMDPNQSGRLQDSLSDDQLLIHEQYHFNITEYYARLFRKAIVNTGKEDLSPSKLKSLSRKFNRQLDSLQFVYDSISDHNVDTEKQRLWELKVDALLRQTEYYSNPDILAYYDFQKDSTNYYRYIYGTINHKVLTSYPVTKLEAKYGGVYEVIRDSSEVEIRYFMNGQLSNGGFFDTAITNLSKSGNKVVFSYRNPDSTYNAGLKYSILKSTLKQNGDIINHYYNEKDERISQGKIYETVWAKQENGIVYSSYFDKNGDLTTNSDKVYHEKRSLDSIGRTTKIECFDMDHERENNKFFVSIYEYSFNKNHKTAYYRLFDSSGEYAKHLTSFNRQYVYDERGNVKERVNLNESDDKVDDKDGVCTYKYTYDRYDNRTASSKYNKLDLPVLAKDGFFQSITKYDSLNRPLYNADYFPGHILMFDTDKWGGTKYEYPNDTLILKYNVSAYYRTFDDDTGIAIIEEHIDSNQRVKKRIYRDLDGYFAKTEDNIAQYEFEYDKSGNTTKQAALDSLGDLIAFEADVAVVKWEYDDRNNKIKTTFYNTEGSLANSTQNVTYNVYTYNDDGFLIESKNYDRNFKPATYDGIFKTVVTPNRHQSDSVVKHYGVNNRLISGVCHTVYQHNRFGELMEEVYYNSQKRRIKNKAQISGIKYQYNDKQHYTGYHNLDTFNRLTNDSNGIAIEQRSLNDSGYLNDMAYFDKNHQPVIGTEGYHKLEYIWDDSGEIITMNTYGTDGKFIEDYSGIAQIKYEKYKTRLTESVRYYDKNLHLTEDADGVAVYLYAPNLNGLYFIDKKLNKNEDEILEEEPELE